MKTKDLIRPIYRRLNHLYRLAALGALRIILRRRYIRSTISIGYKSGGKNDGFGAQLQRVLAINGLAYYLSLEVKHDAIESIAIHPLDGLDDPKVAKRFLEDVNRVIGIETEHKQSVITDSKLALSRYYFDEIRFGKLLRLALFSGISKRETKIEITHPYFLVDVKPQMYKCPLNYEISQRLMTYSSRNLEDAIALHHRQGVGGMVVQPGQSDPRELDFNVYLVPLLEATNKFKDSEVLLFTDAPMNVTTFEPPKNQESAWKGLPAFDGKKMTIEAKSFSDYENGQIVFNEIIRGGNPMIALADMMNARGLIICRSSFGYVAGLLASHNNIWMPEDFWHPALPYWRKYKVAP